MFKLNYILIPLFVAIIVLFCSLIATQGIGWYNLLKLPSFIPTIVVGSIIFIIIFILTAFSALLYWNRAYRNFRFLIVIILFIINGILVFLWSYLFFNLHLVGAAIVEMLFLETTIIALIALTRHSSRTASIFLYPYAIWIVFVIYLVYQILLLNT